VCLLLELSVVVCRLAQASKLVNQFKLWSSLDDRHIVRLFGICIEPQLALISEVLGCG
jgi:hypothetical protein